MGQMVIQLTTSGSCKGRALAASQAGSGSTSKTSSRRAAGIATKKAEVARLKEERAAAELEAKEAEAEADVDDIGSQSLHNAVVAKEECSREGFRSQNSFAHTLQLFLLRRRQQISFNHLQDLRG